MRKVLLILLAVLLPALIYHNAYGEVWSARYGVGETFRFKLFNTDGTLDVDEADSGTEVTVSCNEADAVAATNDFVDEGNDYSIALTAAEMQCERVAVYVGATTLEVFYIQTLDHASAMTPNFVQSGDSFARLGAPAGASHAADIVVLDNFVDDIESRLGTPANLGGGATVAQNLSDIEAQTDDIGAAGAGLTALASQSSVNIIDDFLDTEVAAILDDTGTSGVVIAEATANCREVLGCDTQGTLSGTHTTTVADLGTNAPANQIVGMTLVIPTHNFSALITSYNTSTGEATFDPATAETLANGNQYYVYATPQATSGGGGGLDAAGVRAAIGLATANLDTQLSAIDNFVDDVESRLGTPSNLGGGATLAANAADIEAQTDDIGAAGAGLTSADDAVMTRIGTPVGASLVADVAAVESGISWNSAWDAEVQSEANDAIVANLLDRLLLTSYDPASPPGAADSLLEDLVESDAGQTRFNTNALENGPAGGGGGSSDWSAGEREQIRYALGLDGTATAPTTGTPNLATGAQVAAVEADTQDIQARLPAALILGRMASQVGGYESGQAPLQPTVEGRTADVSAGGEVGIDWSNIGSPTTSVTLSGTTIGTATALGAGAVSPTSVATGAIDADAISSDGATEIVNILRDSVVEDQGSITWGCLVAALGAVLTGDNTTSSGTTTFEEHTGTEVRVVSTQTPTSRAVTITCPTY